MKKKLMWVIVISIVLSFILAIGTASPVRADDRAHTRELVEKARISFESMMADKKMEPIHDLITKAKGVFIAPEVLKGAFVFGASGGSGVFFARDEKTGGWYGPAFYTIGEASFGFQIGGQASEIILLAMTDRGVTSLLSSSVKLGGDVGIAAGPVGAGAGASTANLSADIISFSRSKGLYGGISLDGAVVASREAWNEAYYGKKVTPTDVFIRHDVSSKEAAGLIEAIERASGRR